MNQRNYQKELEKLITEFEKEGKVPTLMLHSCCGPCSSYVLEYLSKYFSITLYFYNPNIYPPKEFFDRSNEQQRLIADMKLVHPVTFVEGNYDPDEFYKVAKGLEKEPEGGARCEQCFNLRLRHAAIAAKAGGFDYFTTTLSISPLKKSNVLNEIGEKMAMEYGVKHLPSDFKKKEGYKRSVQLSNEFDLYRQDYCGCVYSIRK